MHQQVFSDKLRPPFYWLTAASFLLANVFFLLFDTLPTADYFKSIDAFPVPLAPFGVLLLVVVLPKQIQNSIAHFRIVHPLPGSEAFTKWAKLDPRISYEQLKSKHGPLPRKRGSAQNKKWFGLYKDVRDEPSVIAIHRKYLLFRDLATIQFCVVLSWLLMKSLLSPYSFAVLGGLIGIYFLFVLATRNTSVQLVQTVLAIS